MRIAWLTPLSSLSGISKYSIAVLGPLSRLAAVDVFAPDGEVDPYPVPGVVVRSLRSDDATVAALSAYDLVVHNAGNNPSFHDVIYDVYRRVPGLVVVHDKRMHGFFHHLWCVAERRPAHYARMMRHYYGAAGEEVAATVLRGGVSVDTFDEFPLIEPFLWNAHSCVMHSTEAMALVGARYGSLMPLAEIGLPFDPEAATTGPLLSRAELGVPDSEVLLVSHGGVYPQKRLESVLRAVAAVPEVRDAVRLAIVGGGARDYIERLGTLSADLGIADRVVVTGRVDDRTMYSWVAAADVAVNLRYPSMESASLSLVEQMSFGKPVIASDVSYYSQLPDEVALKIPVDIDAEAQGLQVALGTLVADSGRREAMGAAAAAYAAEHHSPRRYAERFVAFAETVAGRTGHLRSLDEAADGLLELPAERAVEAARATAASVLAGGVR